MVDFLLKIPERGGGSREEGPRGREGVCGELGIWGGGGAKYFFFGPKCPPRKSCSCPKFGHNHPFLQPLKKTQKSGHYTTLCDTILHDFI